MAMMISSVTVLSDGGGAPREHTVGIDPVRGTANCTCEAYRYAKPVKICKHVVFVAEALTTV